MIRNSLAIASVVAALTGAAMAQTAPQTAPQAPAQTAPAMRQAPSSLAPNEFTTRSLVGMTVYAPKPANAATRSADPATTASTMPAPSAAPAAMDDAQWRVMRERHDNIGEVNSLVLTSDGRVKQVVLGVGGFLGIGEKSVAIDWHDLRLIRDSNGKMSAIVMRTKEQLNAMPNFVEPRT
ncbi:MAG: PRC-barrel domain-containing protein [Rhizobiales bacterium]|nr:PRC-barrel domain-containing protein [Hyphomicrobiales bacterium]